MFRSRKRQREWERQQFYLVKSWENFWLSPSSLSFSHLFFHSDWTTVVTNILFIFQATRHFLLLSPPFWYLDLNNEQIYDHINEGSLHKACYSTFSVPCPLVYAFQYSSDSSILHTLVHDWKVKVRHHEWPINSFILFRGLNGRGDKTILQESV